VLVQWCLKGIPRTPAFTDAEAKQALLSAGLLSNWMRANATMTLDAGLASAHQMLSDTALAAHVNSYATVASTTPYLSLTAGVVERDPTTRHAIHHPAWTTALDFATSGGASDGYVFECWVQLPGNPAPELPGFGEEVRDLNLQPRFAWWHHEGEIVAKLGVPARQIRLVFRFARNQKPVSVMINKDFVPPERISNIRSLV
jgi:hypothetical protein